MFRSSLEKMLPMWKREKEEAMIRIWILHLKTPPGI